MATLHQRSRQLGMALAKIVAWPAQRASAGHSFGAVLAIHIAGHRGQESFQRDQAAVGVFQPVAFEVGAQRLPARGHRRTEFTGPEHGQPGVSLLDKSLDPPMLLAEVGRELGCVGQPQRCEHRPAFAGPGAEVAVAGGVQLRPLQRLVDRAQAAPGIARQHPAQRVGLTPPAQVDQQGLDPQQAAALGV